jgi:hypothetical protein
MSPSFSRPLALCTVLILLLVGGQASADLIHRWSFNQAGGITAVDSIGDADGMLRGAGGSITAGSLHLPGGSSQTAAYLDLPNGLISDLENPTFEGWATIAGLQSWARIFDFGSTAGGELARPGGGGDGQDYLAYAALRDTFPSRQRIEMRNLDPAFGGTQPGNVGPAVVSLDTNIPTALGEEFHFAIVYDSAAGELRHYRNGLLAGSRPVETALGSLNDVNNWIGRSNWTSDDNFEGAINEFRIYDAPQGAGEILTSFVRGPDLTTTGDYNASGLVEQADLDLVLTNWGQSATPPPPGWINDLPMGFIDQLELDVVLLNWGATGVMSVRNPLPVPEPAAACLAGLAGIVIAASRIVKRQVTAERPNRLAL